MRKTQFITEGLYHIYNRGTEKRNIFLDRGDIIKFIRLLRKHKTDLVDIVCYVLMINHYHLLLKQLQDNGISKFMHKLSLSYTKFFNTKYQRNGVLFQGKFKDVDIQSDGQLIQLSTYIHINPVKDRNDLSIDAKMNLLNKYLWSSYQDYVGLRKGTLVNKQEIVDCFDKFNFIKGYKKEIRGHLVDYDRKNEVISSLILE